MPPRSRSLSVALPALLTLGACQGVTMRPHGATAAPGTSTGVAPLGRPADPTAPGDAGADGRARASDPRVAAAGHTSGEQRRVCRSGNRPRGWIAVAYVLGAGDCPLHVGRDTVYTAAVLTRYAGLPIGSLLDVCADEHVPAGWTREAPDPENVGDSCPGSTRNGGSATYRIRRQN